MVDNDNEVLLTDDGHPIGQVVIADNTSVPVDRHDDMERSDVRDALTKTTAQELTGDPDADSAVAELYPEYGNPDKRREAMLLFVKDGMAIDDVARRVGVPSRTVAQWMFVGQWEKLVKNEIAARQAESILGLARLRSQQRLGIAEEQLEQARKIRETAMTRINEGEGSLKSNTESWAAAAKIEHTITGVSEAGTVADIDGSSGDKKTDDKGKTPLVFIFNGGLPPRGNAT